MLIKETFVEYLGTLCAGAGFVATTTDATLLALVICPGAVSIAPSCTVSLQPRGFDNVLSKSPSHLGASCTALGCVSTTPNLSIVSRAIVVIARAIVVIARCRAMVMVMAVIDSRNSSGYSHQGKNEGEEFHSAADKEDLL